MCSKATSLLLAGLVGLTGLLATPVSSFADPYLGLGGGSGPRIEFRIGEDDRDRRGGYREERWRDREERFRERCSPERALWKAERMGLRRARVVDVGRREIVVRGRDRGDRVTVVFGRAPHCPVIGY